ncbi:MAG: hypothetical protein PHP08_02575 [Candidatus Dojkabacteria bacterium]|nr:hypothetical protein [Candidatus Dojkabacteria bacterium]
MGKIYLSVLRDINYKLVGIDWYLIGKTNLLLQGVDVEPSKIGILIQYKDLDKVWELLKDYKKSEIIELDNKEAKEFYFYINDIKIEICAEYSHGTYWKLLDKHVDYRLGESSMKLFSLKSEMKAYELLGDEEMSRKISGCIS